MALPLMIGEFRAGGDAELRFTPSGQAVANFSIIANKAKKDETAEGGWVNTGETGWIRVNAWGALAERCADDVTKGCKIYVVGEYEQRKYSTRDGGEGTSIELTARAIEVLPERTDSRPGGQQQRPQSSGGGDPWATPPAAGNDEPPF